MSHRPERIEKDCLNCGTIVQGKYCHICGQENAVPKETFWQLLTHFVYDLTHFDGNFFSTIKYLLFKPGFLSAEYVRGRRAKYLNPIRMYIFTSAFFFLFFFSVVKTEEAIQTDGDKTTYKKVSEKIDKRIKTLEAAISDSAGSDVAITIMRDQLALLKKDKERLKADTTKLGELHYYNLDGQSLYPEKFKTVKEYDSAQARLPEKQKDGWISSSFQRRKLSLSEKYGGDTRLILNKLFDKFMHSFPQVLFVSLPLLALILRLLYIRRRKNFFYVDHIIYSVHLYCAMFISIFLLMCVSRLKDLPYMAWLNFIGLALFIYIFWYIYKSMRKFYQQSRIKTFLKFWLLLSLSSFVMGFLFLAFLILSAYII